MTWTTEVIMIRQIYRDDRQEWAGEDVPGSFTSLRNQERQVYSTQTQGLVCNIIFRVWSKVVERLDGEGLACTTSFEISWLVPR